MTPSDSHDGDVIDGELEEPTSRAVDAYRPRAPSQHPLDADPKQFAIVLQQRGDNYAMLIGWLVENLDPEADVARVHFVKRDKCRDGGPPACTPTTNPGHWSDPDLSRSGVEKVCGLLGLGARYLGMQDFRRQALKGVKITDVIIDCELYAQADGPAVSQGTGACNVDEVSGSLNNCMKRAAKRAKADALKSVAGLSGLATELKKRMAPRDPDATVKQAADAQRRARYSGEGRGRWNTGAVLTHCPMGVHKDKPWREVPTKYLEWATGPNGWQDKPDLLRAAAEELSKRRDAGGSSSTHTQPSPHSDMPPDPPPEVFDDDIPF